MKKLNTGSVIVGKLPEGCMLCQQGAKTVLFVTGLCARRCFYCPLGLDRKGVDVIYVNERKVRKYKDIIDEAVKMDALGTGLTGGDPLLTPGRTIKLIKLLKENMGSDHHVHLYTTGTVKSLQVYRKLVQAGLDEIRFHPSRKDWSVLKQVRKIIDIPFGGEIPVIPGHAKEAIEFLKFMDEIGADFVNLNELEFSDTNSLNLLQRGLKLAAGSYAAVEGSLEEGIKILRWGEENTGLNLHLCPVSVKDKVQTRLRFYRTAVNVAEPYETVTDEGTLITLRVEGSRNELMQLIHDLALPKELVGFGKPGAIFIHPEFLDELLRRKGNRFKLYIWERLPTPGRALVSSTPV